MWVLLYRKGEEVISLKRLKENDFEQWRIRLNHMIEDNNDNLFDGLDNEISTKPFETLSLSTQLAVFAQLCYSLAQTQPASQFIDALEDYDKARCHALGWDVEGNGVLQPYLDEWLYREDRHDPLKAEAFESNKRKGKKGRKKSSAKSRRKSKKVTEEKKEKGDANDNGDESTSKRWHLLSTDVPGMEQVVAELKKVKGQDDEHMDLIYILEEEVIPEVVETAAAKKRAIEKRLLIDAMPRKRSSRIRGKQEREAEEAMLLEQQRLAEEEAQREWEEEQVRLEAERLEVQRQEERAARALAFQQAREEEERQRLEKIEQRRLRAERAAKLKQEQMDEQQAREIAEAAEREEERRLRLLRRKGELSEEVEAAMEEERGEEEGEEGEQQENRSISSPSEQERVVKKVKLGTDAVDSAISSSSPSPIDTSTNMEVEVPSKSQSSEVENGGPSNSPTLQEAIKPEAANPAPVLSTVESTPSQP